MGAKLGTCGSFQFLTGMATAFWTCSCLADSLMCDQRVFCEVSLFGGSVFAFLSFLQRVKVNWRWLEPRPSIGATAKRQASWEDLVFQRRWQRPRCPPSRLSSFRCHALYQFLCAGDDTFQRGLGVAKQPCLLDAFLVGCCVVWRTSLQDGCPHLVLAHGCQVDVFLGQEDATLKLAFSLHFAPPSQLELGDPAFAGSCHLVPTVSDWNRDGQLDIIVGDCEAQLTHG